MTPRNRNWRELIAADFLETDAAGFAAPLVAEGEGLVSRETPGTMVGRYRLLEEIGRGGMGTVWLAERADGHFEQQVALKLVKRGMDSDELLTRFIRERQILARLEHPNIARLLDGGVSEDGRPYFVMELVQGERITRYAETRHLSLEQRLRLVATVCRAVQQAHRNLVVHRDLKPSNVLITDAGEVKLLDFGVARLLTDSASDEKVATREPLTPEYASPEQLSGGAVTTASDVYQLGMLLYELLTGTRPGSGAGLNRLRGDLETMVQRALRREPEQRYPSVEALAEDIERYLAHLPIRFGDRGWWYRTAKFGRRHRLQVITATVLVLGLLVGGWLYLASLRHARQGAEREAAKASESAVLLGRFFQGWSPDAADRGQISADAVLGDATRRAERELSRDPEMLAATLSMLGELYSGLGRTGSADSLLSRALTIQQGLSDRPSVDLAATLGRRGKLMEGLGHSIEAEPLLRRSLAMYRSLLAPDRGEILRAQHRLAQALWTQEKLTEAEALLRDALQKSPDPESPFATEIASELGYVLFREARYAEATGLLRTALARQRRSFGSLHQSTLRTMRFLASALRNPQDLPEAEALDREALRIARTLFGEGLETTVGAMALAVLLERKGDFTEAERMTRDALRFFSAAGESNKNSALTLRTLGGIRLVQGDLGDAEQLLRRGLASLREVEPGNPDEGDIRNRLAYLAFVRQAADSLEVYRDAVAFEQSRPAAGPFFITDGYEYLASAARRRGDRALAERLYRRAVELYQRELPQGHPYRTQAEAGLAEVLAQRK